MVVITAPKFGLSGNMQSAAMKYCKIRIVTNAVSAVVCAFVTIVLSFFVRKWMGDTGKWLPTQAVVRGGQVSSMTTKDGTSYNLTFTADYTVDNKKYVTTVAGPSGFSSKVLAEANLASAVNSKTLNIYFDPVRPDKSTTVRNREDYVMATMMGLGVLALGYGIISYMMRDNPIMCGLQVASNVRSIFNNS